MQDMKDKPHMQAEKHKPIDAPCAWRGADMKNRTDWLRSFSAAELVEIDTALQAVKQRGIDLFDVEKHDFPLPNFARGLADISRQLETGIGMIMLRGLPLSYSPEDLRIVYWGIGTHLGTAVSQNKTGELFGTVKDFQEEYVNTTRRGSRTSEGLQFHSDRCDVVGLLCVRKAKEGGASRIVSAAAIHNEILRTRPDLLEVLYQPFTWSMLRQERPGEPKYYQQPVFSVHEGHFCCRLVRPHITLAQRFPDVPRLTAKQIEALDLFDELVARPDFQLATNFQPGDLQFCNNHTAMHARTAFEDYEEEGRRRHLLRLWLSVPNSRPLSPLMQHIYKDLRGGTARGGFQPRVPGKIVFETTGAETVVT